MGPAGKFIKTVSDIKIMNGFFLEKTWSGRLFMLSLPCLLKTVRVFLLFSSGSSGDSRQPVLLGWASASSIESEEPVTQPKNNTRHQSSGYNSGLLYAYQLSSSLFLKKALKCLLKATVFWVPTRPEGETKSSGHSPRLKRDLSWGLCCLLPSLGPLHFPALSGSAVSICFGWIPTLLLSWCLSW